MVRFLVWIISAAVKPKALLIPAGCRESVPAAAVTGAAAQAPAAALAQCGPTVLDLRQSMVRRLAQFAPYCEARNGAEMASTGLACLLVLAIKSAAPKEW